MRLIRGLHNVKSSDRGCVATIGNFDGVHLGHAQVITAVKQRAEALGLPSLAITFEPTPIEYFAPDKAPARLTRLAEKLHLLEAQQIDRTLILRFNQFLATQPAEEFVKQILVEQLGVKHLYVGDDFCFGHQRKGNFALLQQMGEALGFAVESLPTFEIDAERVSSTRIRGALLAGDFNQAEKCLGRDYRITGRVGHGDKRGRQIGFPTMNIQLGRLHPSVRGVFAVRIDGLEQGPQNGVANVGNRPTVEGDDRFTLEVHALDFNANTYGQRVSVHFMQRIRDEKKFESFEALTTQIQKDVETARDFFKQAQQ